MLNIKFQVWITHDRFFSQAGLESPCGEALLPLRLSADYTRENVHGLLS